MRIKDKEVLKKAVESNEGLISPSTMISSYAGGSRKIVEMLVTSGHVEMVPEEIHTGKVINFYRVTEKGIAAFYPWHRKLWFNIKGDTRTIAVAVIISILTTLVTLYIQSAI